jgi:hypothetical protein
MTDFAKVAYQVFVIATAELAARRAALEYWIIKRMSSFQYSNIP